MRRKSCPCLENLSMIEWRPNLKCWKENQSSSTRTDVLQFKKWIVIIFNKPFFGKKRLQFDGSERGEDFLVHFLPKSLKETEKVFSVVVVFGIMLRLSRHNHGILQPGNGSDPTKLWTWITALSGQSYLKLICSSSRQLILEPKVLQY